MILKFEDYINESLWKKTIERSKTGERRLEELTKFDSYMSKVKWVDLGHPNWLYAEYDFEERLSINDIISIKKHFPDDIKIMTYKEFDFLKVTCQKTPSNLGKDIKYVGKNSRVIYFKNTVVYVTGLNSITPEIVDYFFIIPINGKHNICEKFDDLSSPTFSIKLVKSKHVSESLWKKTIERSKTGERRIEDMFTKSDLDEFDPKNLNIFLRNHKLSDIMSDYRRNVKDTYSKYVEDYARQHGTLQIGFTSDDEAPLPDFSFKFHITDLKDVMVHVSYNDQYKEIKVMCGNDKDEFDISELEFGRYLISYFKHSVFDDLKENFDILFKNIKMNWDVFSEHLYDFVYNCCYDDFIYDKIHYHNVNFTPLMGIEIDTLYQKKDPILAKFYFDGVSFNHEGMDVFLTGKNISDTHEGKRIIEIYKQAYNDAKEKIKEEG